MRQSLKLLLVWLSVGGLLAVVTGHGQGLIPLSKTQDVRDLAVDHSGNVYALWSNRIDVVDTRKGTSTLFPYDVQATLPEQNLKSTNIGKGSW